MNRRKRLSVPGRDSAYERGGDACIGVRAGGRGGLQPPQILGNSDFLGSKRKFGQSYFLKTFPCFFISLKRQIFSILI